MEQIFPGNLEGFLIITNPAPNLAARAVPKMYFKSNTIND